MTPLAVILILAQVSGTSLADTVRAVEEGAEVTVPREVGAQAARALLKHEAMSSAQVEAHLQVALKGQAHRELAPAMARLLADDGVNLESALRALAGVSARERTRTLADVAPAVATRYRIRDAWAHEDDLVARGALLVAVPACAPREAADLLARVSSEVPERTPWVLEALEVTPPSLALLEALLAVEAQLPAASATALGGVLAGLVDRDPELADPLVEALARNPASHALLASTAAVPPDRFDAAAEVVMGLVSSLAATPATLRATEVELLVSAIQAGADLRSPDLFYALPGLCQPGTPTPVRVAALRAIGALGAREATTIDLLIGHLSEPEPLASAAYEALCLRARERMPQRPGIWSDWRARTELVEMTLDEHVERLAAERQARHRARRAAARRAARD